ncbi:hypothetical protein SISNIDRAFT_480989 [Sistotremastrum niveocremeum HHB9708]|uniref:Uncharacterized protein n=1 Tax=Sistotremastrum niveocremeum HHB9708 TaxID=1314777 RepID=A0A164ZY32_9AGAM|nr:hypothetical protein SISNIDRAFT_480989 [Sistotremastrum niveocremeum HHB9708]
MSMDRKNKKAAQQAANGGSGKGDRNGRKEVEGGKNDGHRERGASSGPLPTRVKLAGTGLKAPISISKATISPSAPAPALTDVDFDLGGLDDRSHDAASTKANAQQSTDVVSAPSTKATTPPQTPPNPNTTQRSPTDSHRPPALPLHTPSAPRGFVRSDGSPVIDFGPVGSPPRSSPITTGLHIPSSTQPTLNGFSSGTSPPIASSFKASSPFSAPGGNSIFMSYNIREEDPMGNEITRHPTLASSLGPGTTLGSRGWDIQAGRSRYGSASAGLGGDHNVDTESSAFLDDNNDLEDFLPSSLTELLTPDEKRRRLSRSNNARPTLESLHHRHSRSVPALSLLDNMSNLWGDGNQRSTQHQHKNPGHAFGTTSNGPSPSILGTSNVSAGFLPNVHMARPAGAGSRTVSDTQALQSSLARSPPSHTGLLGRALNEGGSSYLGMHPVGLKSSNHEDMLSAGLNHLALSPSSRALQAHAPGSSLPKGLAAGYSRIHARPGPLMSPSSYGPLSPPLPANPSEDGSTSPNPSRVSYSAAAAGSRGRSPSAGNGSTPPIPMQIGSGAYRRAYPTPLSPLALGAVTADDDVTLFDMDGFEDPSHA